MLTIAIYCATYVLNITTDIYCKDIALSLHNINRLSFSPSSSAFDGLLLSNGPGDPEMCKTTISHIARYISNEAAKPLFGICLGHQLLSLAVGAKAYKMKCVCVCVCV